MSTFKARYGKLLTIMPPSTIWGIVGAVGNLVMAILAVTVMLRFVAPEDWTWIVIVYGGVLWFYFFIIVIFGSNRMSRKYARGRTVASPLYYEASLAWNSFLGYTLLTIVGLIFIIPKTVGDLLNPLNAGALAALMATYVTVALVALSNSTLNVVGHGNRLKRIAADEALKQILDEFET